ncbi:UbiA prenyltransferase family protein [Nonlabens ponticola]|uniref:Prenyltransferase n=1 Tax=Nonlabens ponticola TaxID=2496866 RepID=A0A3S9MY53_9FLAO|nr:hypothetical protein [Nonlabens ponticola]AZQ44064.1 hypothetical protein EJ995_07400 [Nonlabens ponticola]
MNLSRRLIKFYVDSSLHVALGLTSLTIVSFLKFNLPIELKTIALVFFSTVSGYNLIKYSHQWRTDLNHHLAILCLSTVFALFSMVLLSFHNWLTIAIIASVTFISVWYVLPKQYGLSLRRMPIMKLIAVGITWALMSIALPIAESELLFFFLRVPSFLTILFTQTVLLVMVWCLPFEIRDLKVDDPNLKTLPQLIGVPLTKVVGYILLIACGLLGILVDNYDNGWNETDILIYLLTALLLYFSTQSRSDYYASLVVESIPVLWMILLIIAD